MKFSVYHLRLILSSCFVLLVSLSAAFAGSPEGQERPPVHEKHEINETINRKPTGLLGVNEQLGSIIPADIRFLDEHSNSVILTELITKPTLIIPVYFHCPDVCPLLMANLAAALNDVVLTPGEDFQVIAFSFDPDDTPEFALKAKKNYGKILNETFPQTAWTFLTGSPDHIKKLTDAIGFQYQQTGKYFFNHPSVLVTISGTGKIIRYIYGPNFLPFDLSMALSEAEKGTPSVSIKKLLTFCFSYDPVGKKYVFNTFRLVAISTLIILALFYFFVLRKGRKDNS